MIEQINILGQICRITSNKQKMSIYMLQYSNQILQPKTVNQLKIILSFSPPGMKILIYIGLAGFYLHYYLLLALFTLSNALKFILNLFTQKQTQKHKISPFEIAHKDVFTSLYQFISHEGFVFEVFTFQTVDKVSVEMWRINKKDKQLTKPYPVLLMHGLLDCSVSWFLQVDKSKSLPYMLADQGYEVWLGNNRGNIISQKQEHPDQQFWDYNLDHLIEHDQPAIIEGVLQKSKKDKLIYVGHSQGSAQFILALGVHNKLAQKIAGFVGLGTVVSLACVKDHLMLKLLDKFKLVELCRWLGFKKILVLPRMLTKSVGVLIYNSRLYYGSMMMFVRMLCGHSEKNKISEQLFGVMITHEPGGSSSNNALHWVQCYRNGVMKKFDYGPKKNLEIYGSETPQTYCLEHLQSLPFKTYLFRGMKDAVINDQNFESLISRFHSERIQWFELDDYHHLEYIWSETAHIDVYPQIINIIEGIKS